MVNISALYTSIKRISEIVPLPLSGLELGDGLPAFDHGRLRLIAAAEQGLASWLSRTPVPTLGELVATSKLAEGEFFTHYGPWIGKGVAAAGHRFSQGKTVKALPIVYAKLDGLSEGLRMQIPLHPSNFTTRSSWDGLSRQNRLLVLGRVTKATLPNLEAQAYAIGHVHAMDRPAVPGMDVHSLLQNRMEASVHQIDSFEGINDVPIPSRAEMERLRGFSETDVKRAFAEIMGVPHIPKDWGGERSDLVAHRIRLNGAPVVAAFAFKGPAKFKPLTVADMGKNGDQIGRLFTEPADLFVVQHCHTIESSVRETMRAFATRFYDLRPFCLIDGTDTMRILKLHGKLGF